MTIRGVGYRAAPFEPVPAWRRWWPIAHQEFLFVFRRRWGLVLFCVCLLPLVVRIFVLMVRFGVVNFGGMRAHLVTRSLALQQWDPMYPDFYVEAIVTTFPGLMILVALTSAVTAGAVARDRATNALELLWTRGISPAAYFLAKWVGAVSLVSLVTVMVPLVLWVFAVLVAEDWSLFEGTVAFVPQMLGGMLLVTAIWTTLCLLLSSIASAPNQAIVTWCIVMVGSSGVANVMAVVFREPAMRSWISIWDAGGVLARACAGIATRGAPVVPAAIVLGSAILVLSVLARRRLSVTEAVG